MKVDLRYEDLMFALDPQVEIRLLRSAGVERDVEKE